MKTLLTGFNRFGNLQENSSQLVVEHLASRTKLSNAMRLITEVLPTEYIRAGERIRDLILECRPERIICLGVSMNLAAIHLERIALNIDDADAPDNAGMARKGKAIIPDAPLAYGSTLPLEKMRASLEKRRIPAAISNHAGTFLCNHVFYLARHEVEVLHLKSPCGFLHLPGVSKAGAADDPEARGLPLNLLIEAVECCLQTGR